MSDSKRFGLLGRHLYLIPMEVECDGSDHSPGGRPGRTHKKSVTATVRTPGPGGGRVETVRTFKTFLDELIAMRDWLVGLGVTHVAMEATSSYWLPVWRVLEDDGNGPFEELVLCNARHVKYVPGRKTDVKDASWLCQLLEVGLLAGSFVPPPEIRRLRTVTRYRKRLTQLRTAEVQRVEKTLEDAVVKLGSVASATLTKSGRMIDWFDATSDALNSRVAAMTVQWTPTMDRLDAIPGVARRTSEVIIAETGGDMSRFPTHQHLASWAGLCPGHNESGGKRRSGKTTHGNVWLADALTQAAWAAARTNDSYLQAKFWRIAGPRADDKRKKKAAVAVAHKILIAAYHLMADPNATYHDLGGNHFARRDDPDRRRDRLVGSSPNSATPWTSPRSPRPDRHTPLPAWRPARFALPDSPPTGAHSRVRPDNGPPQATATRRSAVTVAVPSDAHGCRAAGGVLGRFLERAERPWLRVAGALVPTSA